MDEIIEKLKDLFVSNNCKELSSKLACTIGYLEAYCKFSDLQSKDVIEIFIKLFIDEI